jgi:hypothetical protein
MNIAARVPVAVLAALGAACALAGCGAEQTHTGVFESRDSARVMIARNSLDTPPDVERWTIDSLPVRMFGVAAGAPEYQFSGAQDITRLANGGIVVLNYSSRELRLFDSTGAFVTAFGRQGDGPGEFRNMQNLAFIRGDTFAVMDVTRGRATWFSASEGLLRTVIHDEHDLAAMLGEGFHTRQVRPVTDTLLLVEAYQLRAGATALPGGPRIFSFFLLDRIRRRTVRLGPYSEPDPLIVTTSRGSTTRSQPLTPSIFFAVQPGGRLICSAIASQRVVDCLRADGRRMSIRWVSAEVPVKSKTRDDWEAQVRTLLPQQPQDAERIIAVAAWPAFVNPIDGLRIDVDGNIWIRERALDATGSEYLRNRIFSGDGRHIAFASHTELIPVHIGADRLTGVARDSLGVERVLVYTIARGRRGPN